jgi:hypothetical protein
VNVVASLWRWMWVKLVRKIILEVSTWNKCQLTKSIEWVMTTKAMKIPKHCNCGHSLKDNYHQFWTKSLEEKKFRLKEKIDSRRDTSFSWCHENSLGFRNIPEKATCLPRRLWECLILTLCFLCKVQGWILK